MWNIAAFYGGLCYIHIRKKDMIFGEDIYIWVQNADSCLLYV